MRQFVLKEDNKTLPEARRNLQRYPSSSLCSRPSPPLRLYYMDRLMALGFLLSIWQLFAMRSQLAQRMWFFLTTLAVRMYSLLRRS